MNLLRLVLKRRELVQWERVLRWVRMLASLVGLIFSVLKISVVSSVDWEQRDWAATPCEFIFWKLLIWEEQWEEKKKRQVRWTMMPTAAIVPMLYTTSLLSMGSLGFFRLFVSLADSKRFSVSTSKFLRAISTAYFIFSAFSWRVLASASDMYMSSVSFSLDLQLDLTQQVSMKKQRRAMTAIEEQSMASFKKVSPLMDPPISWRMESWLEAIMGLSWQTVAQRIWLMMDVSLVQRNSVTWARMTSTNSDKVPTILKSQNDIVYWVLSKILFFLRAWMRLQDSPIWSLSLKEGYFWLSPEYSSLSRATILWQSILNCSMFWNLTQEADISVALAWKETMSTTEKATRARLRRTTARKMQHSSTDCSLVSFFFCQLACSSKSSLQASLSSRSILQSSPSYSRQVLMSLANSPGREAWAARIICFSSMSKVLELLDILRSSGSLQPRMVSLLELYSSSTQWNQNLLSSFLTWKLLRFCRMDSLRSLLSLDTTICARMRWWAEWREFIFFIIMRQPLQSRDTFAILDFINFSFCSIMCLVNSSSQSIVTGSLWKCAVLILEVVLSMSCMVKSSLSRNMFLRLQQGSFIICRIITFFCFMYFSFSVIFPNAYSPYDFFRKVQIGSSSCSLSDLLAHFLTSYTFRQGKRMSEMLRYLSSKRVHCSSFCPSLLAFSRLPVSGQKVKVGRQFSAMSSKCMCCCTFMSLLMLSLSMTFSLTKLVKNSRQSSIILKLMSLVLSSSVQISFSFSTFWRIPIPSPTMLSIFGCARPSSSQKREQLQDISKMRSQNTLEMVFLLDQVDFRLASLSFVNLSIEYRMKSSFKVSGLSARDSTSHLCPCSSFHNSYTSLFFIFSFLRQSIRAAIC